MRTLPKRLSGSPSMRGGAKSIRPAIVNVHIWWLTQGLSVEVDRAELVTALAEPAARVSDQYSVGCVLGAQTRVWSKIIRPTPIFIASPRKPSPMRFKH